MKKFFLLPSCFFLLSLSCSSVENNTAKNITSEPSPAYSLSLKIIAEGLEAPIGMAVTNDGSNRLFVIEQEGKIRIIKGGKLLSQPFLDLTSRVDHGGALYSEKGLLGLAFHPQYKSNGKFYVYYSSPTAAKGMDNKSVIAEYTVSSSNPDMANITGRVLLEIEEPEWNHNGGQLAFGPDGYLYIGVGDGGGGGDRHGTNGNGQNTQVLLAKILRIGVDATSGYKIPPDNPFINTPSRPEIFAYGLRNPWRFSFDKKTGKLFCGDVGQNEWEEVDIIEKGKNYGWRIMEGNHCYNPSSNCNTTGLTMPIAEYDHSEGKSVIGGYVYRGTKSADMEGKYIFGDWSGVFFMLTQQPSTLEWNRFKLSLKDFSGDFYINSFGEDENGELYVLGQASVGPKKAGKLYQIVFER
ncbi:MAG TPA: PQQ-dependent sugar dehydrogenase [Chitinophagales bacterium]|nr:PQQ-dependent sugar dehydrogenase [Chitinophagales bacterium]